LEVKEAFKTVCVFADGYCQGQPVFELIRLDDDRGDGQIRTENGMRRRWLDSEVDRTAGEDVEDVEVNFESVVPRGVADVRFEFPTIECSWYLSGESSTEREMFRLRLWLRLRWQKLN
jgi:hypothetical protein